MASLQFRSATRADVPAIVEFQIAMARETEDLQLDSQVVNKGVAAVCDDAVHGQYYVAEHAGRVIGCLLITYEWSDWRNGAVWWIQSVYVAPEFRKQGTYAGLYGYVKELAAADPQVR